MPLRTIQINAPANAFEKIKECANKNDVLDFWYGTENEDKRRIVSVLLSVEKQQDFMDDVQDIMEEETHWRIIILPVEGTVPKPENNNENGEKSKAKSLFRGTVTREELYSDIEKNGRLTLNFAILTVLSVLVCAIGLISSNIAVVIGAMVIAPMLGPILALAFGAALGERELITEAIKSNAAGLGLTLFMSFLIGVVFTVPLDSVELISRTEVGFDMLVLAFAAGTAAVLSLTTGLSSTLVGVMVAVALLPPAVTTGLMLGAGQIPMAYSAGLLLAGNVICLSLSAQFVFLLQGIRPRKWYERDKSKQSVKINVIFWLACLASIVALVTLHN